MKRVMLLLWIMNLSLVGKAWISCNSPLIHSQGAEKGVMQIAPNAPTILPMRSTSIFFASMEEDDDVWEDITPGWEDPDFYNDDDNPWEDTDEWADPYITQEEDLPIGNICPLLLMILVYTLAKISKIRSIR